MAQPLFDAPYRWYPTSGPIYSMAAGRLGHDDSTVFVVVSHSDQRTLEFLEADNHSDLYTRGTIRMGNQPRGVAIADFDGDGCEDVVVGGYDPPYVFLLPGRCDGNFGPPRLITTSIPVDGVAVADFNADGFPDLLGWSAGGAVVLLNDGLGGFRPAISIGGPFLQPPAIGRIDSDPYPDLVTSGYGSVTVRYGRGDGTFSADSRIPCDGCLGTATPSLADIDGNGALDVITGNTDTPSGSAIRILFNDGQGRFPNSSLCGFVDRMLASTTIGDVDGDGRPDVISLSQSHGGPVLTLVTNPNVRTFYHPFQRDVESFGQGLVVDVDHDGCGDYLQVDESGVALFRGSRSGRFGPSPMFASYYPDAMFAAHIDDGPTLDIAWSSEQYGNVVFAFGNGDGTFRSDYGSIACPYVLSLSTADLNRDGHNDLLVGAFSADIALGRGDGTFVPGQHFDVSGLVAATSLDGHLYPDLLFATSDSLVAWRNLGDATFEPWRSWPGGGNLLVVGDLNGDGRDDVVLRRMSSIDSCRYCSGTTVVVRLAVAPGGIGSETAYETRAEISDIELADLDGDGHPDIVIAHGGRPPAWLHGRGDGTFEAPAVLGLPPADRFVFADWNGDGKPDAAFLARAWPTGRVGISFGAGGAEFAAPIWLGTGSLSGDLVAGDLDGDGRPDLAVLTIHINTGDSQIGYIDFMFNRIQPAFTTGVGGPAPAQADAFLVGRPAPNPLRSITRIRFSPGTARRVSTRVLDIAGREVRALLQGPVRRDEQEIVWDGRDARGSRVPPGVYLLEVRTESASVTRRIVVLN